MTKPIICTFVATNAQDNLSINFSIMNIKNVKLSLFTHVWGKKSSIITVSNFVSEIQSDHLQVFTETYRRWLQEGKLKEASDMKRNMPAVVPGGVCRGGHAASQLQEISNLMVLDYDHTGERTQELIDLLKQLPYVAVAFISISGEGVKAFIHISMINKTQYARIFSIVSAEVDRVLNFACDKQCPDITRMCFLAHDPNIYYNPEADVFQISEMQLQEAEISVASPTAVHARSVETVPFATDATDVPDAAAGYMATFLTDFGNHHSFVSGNRHDYILKLGQASRYKGFSTSELEELKRLVIEKHAEPDFSSTEIEKALSAGYQYINANLETFEQAKKVQKVQGSPLGFVPPSSSEDEEDEMLEKSNELRAATPYFSEEVYEHLPDLLKRAMKVARSPRERDMFLMGMMANLAAALPYVRFRYDGREYSPHLYYASVAPAAAGKGIVALAPLINDAVHQYYERGYKEQKRQYEENKVNWDLEVQQAQHQKRKPDIALRPEEPKGIYINISGNISKSRLIEHLKNNGELGGIINASEIDTLNSSISQDYGQQDDILRQAAHHEELIASFKNLGEPIRVPHPRLSMCLSGTPNQFVHLIHSQENGLYSRFALLTAESQWKWRSPAPRKDSEEYRNYLIKLGEEVLEMHLNLLQSPTQVEFTPAQWEVHSDFFKQYLSRVAVEGKDYIGAVVYRHGLLTMRLASVFTALRKCEDQWWVEHRTCTDEDLRSAIQMITVLLEHSLLISSSLPEDEHKAQPLKKFHRIESILAQLPECFSYSEFVEEGTKLNFSLSTSKRLLKRSVQEGYTDYSGTKYIKLDRTREQESKDKE